MSPVAVRQVSTGYIRKAMNLAEGGLFKPEERIAERYLVRELLGEGPTGFSYGVYDGVSKLNLRLKIIHPHLLQTAEEQKHFGSVLGRLAHLSHPNLGRIYEVGNTRGRMFYTQQQTEGLSLRRIMDERLVKGSLFSCKEVEPILGQLVQALEAVHKMGLHLNLKPENVFVLPDLLKLSDVGLGLAMARQPFVQAQCKHKAEGYFAPEFLSGMAIDAGADVYSLGVILGEMLGGVLPDSGLKGLRRNNPSIPVQMEAIYHKAVAASPLLRYRSIAEFYDDFCSFYQRYSEGEGQVLDGALAQTHPELPPLPPPQVFPEPSSEISLAGIKGPAKQGLGQLKWVILAGGVLLLMGLLYLLFRDTTPEEYTGRNVEGFLQPPPVAPVPVPVPVPIEPLKNEVVHTEATLPEFLEETAPPEVPVPSEKPPEASRTPRANVPSVAANTRCPEQMRHIPAGSFRMGTERDDLYLSFEDMSAVSKEVGGFCVDIYEYPNRPGHMPQVNVGWAKAKELCQKQGKRLCTEAEWEKACRGSQGLRWPYSNIFDASACNAEGGTGAGTSLAASGKFFRCVSTYAVLDMSGNAAEWTEEKVVKGGSFSGTEHDIRCAARKTKAAAMAEIGFRCCANSK
ncbi:MAG: bifunctional serine/threonine-protein kinase/formylglycine-generating enzyme family protein [Cystobacterineae bacterium]|nr:bifunctional serine/threonine-protein kinase/formylglycine-generating enzyme family protein [Cystobacterineae bacterium]